MTNQPLSVLIDQAQALLAEIAAHPDHLQLLELGWSPDLHIADAQTALIYLDWEIQPESEAIASTTNHCNRPTKYVSLAAKRFVHKDLNRMALDYKNPNDWGKSPLTDRALRLEQFRAENPEQWSAMISADISALSKPIFESENYPPFTGTEFLATHSTIDDHPYSAAFGQFLGNGIDPDIANMLAFGSNRFDLISEDFDDPVRQLATRIYSRFEDMGYWDEVPESDDDINYDLIPY